MATKDKPNNKSLKALFSVICLSIIALGLVVYFSTQKNAVVNEPTSVRQIITTTQNVAKVQRSITVKETTTKLKETTKKQTTTKKQEPTTMTLGETNTPYKSFYKYPVGEAVLKGYSQELVKNETMGDYRTHLAVDFQVNTGSKIVAINDGLVIDVRKDSLLGNVVEIDHGGGLVASYCGLEAMNVSKGDFVVIGQSIATLGKIPFEALDEQHFHFETRLNGKYVNPLDVMGKTE